MATNWTPSPATAPAEAPEIASIKALQDKKADALSYLQDNPDLSAEDKVKFAAEFEADMTELATKTNEQKEKNIGSMKIELEKLKKDIHSEKKDANEDKDEVLGTDETTVSGEQKLNVEKEIRGRLDEFRTSIETKLAAPEAPPTATPEPVEEVPTETQNAINDSREFFANKGVKLDTATPTQGNWFKNFLNKILLNWYWVLEGFGINVGNLKARAEGYQNYESKQVVEETFKVLSDPVRREILIMLKKGKMSAGDITSKFDMTGATISYHLSKLKKADLIYETKYKNFIYYELNASLFEELLLWFSQFKGDDTNER